jgi:hypothetical protein
MPYEKYNVADFHSSFIITMISQPTFIIYLILQFHTHLCHTINQSGNYNFYYSIASLRMKSEVQYVGIIESL